MLRQVPKIIERDPTQLLIFRVLVIWSSNGLVASFSFLCSGKRQFGDGSKTSLWLLRIRLLHGSFKLTKFEIRKYPSCPTRYTRHACYTPHLPQMRQTHPTRYTGQMWQTSSDCWLTPASTASTSSLRHPVVWRASSWICGNAWLSNSPWWAEYAFSPCYRRLIKTRFLGKIYWTAWKMDQRTSSYIISHRPWIWR